MLNVKPTTTPMVKKNEKLFEQDSFFIIAYRRIIGRLLYLVYTRLDIDFSVHFLDQFIQAPIKLHQAAQRILIYVKSSSAQGIFYPKDTNIQIQTFSDSDLASCVSTRRSTTGYCIFLGESLVSRKNEEAENYINLPSKQNIER